MEKIKLFFDQFKLVTRDISKLTFSDYGEDMIDCLIECDDYYEIQFSGYITTIEDLIKYIIKLSLEHKIDISEVSSFDNEIDFENVKLIKHYKNSL